MINSNRVSIIKERIFIAHSESLLFVESDHNVIVVREIVA